jgi:hypothetical protein
METIPSPKRRFERELHGTKSQKASIIDTAVKASHRTGCFENKLYPSLDWLTDRDSAVTQLWNPIILRNHEYGENTFSETSVRI